LKSNKFHGFHVTAIALLLFSAQLLAESTHADKNNNNKPETTIVLVDKPIREGRKAVDFFTVNSATLRNESRLTNSKKSYPAAQVERLQPLLELGSSQELKPLSAKCCNLPFCYSAAYAAPCRLQR
jgi:hypothetical protein